MQASGYFPFGQVPLFEQGSYKLAQSNAIARYLAKRHGLAGSSDEEAAFADSICEGIVDARTAMRSFLYDKDASEEKKAELKKKFAEETLPKWTGYFEKILKGHGGDWITGKNFTVADIVLYYYYSTVAKDFPNRFDKAPLLQALVERVAIRPRIAKWVKERPVTEF